MQLASLTQKRHVFVVMSMSLKVALCFYKQYSFMETQQQIILNLNPRIAGRFRWAFYNYLERSFSRKIA